MAKTLKLKRRNKIFILLSFATRTDILVGLDQTNLKITFFYLDESNSCCYPDWLVLCATRIALHKTADLLNLTETNEKCTIKQNSQNKRS